MGIGHEGGVCGSGRFPFLCLFCLVMGVPALVYACLQMWVYRKDGTVATFCLLYSSLVFTLLLYFCYLGDSEVQNVLSAEAPSPGSCFFCSPGGINLLDGTCSRVHT